MVCSNCGTENDLELPEVYAQALSSRAIALMNHGRTDEAGTLLRRALQVAWRTISPRLRSARTTIWGSRCSPWTASRRWWSSLSRHWNWRVGRATAFRN
jgi:hypothetical protein